MKMKKRRYDIGIAVLIMAVLIVTGVLGLTQVQAATVRVYINGTELQNNKYYEFVVSGFTTIMYERDSDSGLTDYISYNNGAMEVYGNVYIYSNGSDTAGVLRIENGTLTLKGAGNLTIRNEQQAAAVVTGTADAAFTTDGYTGSLYFYGKTGGSLIQGLALVDLKTTGNIEFSGSYITGDAFLSAGSVNLEAADFYFKLYDAVKVKHFIEATDTQSGKINLVKTGTINSLRLKNGYTNLPSENIYVSEAFFKGKDVTISSKGENGSGESIWFSGNAIADGNLRIDAEKSITITTQDTLADGNLEVHSQYGDNVTLTSEAGSLSTGNTDIDALSARTTLKGKGIDAVIKGNATIAVRVLEIIGEHNSAITGNADLLTSNGSIKLSSPEGYSVIAGSTIRLDAGNYDISISRGGSGAADTPPILGGTLQADKGAVHYEDGGTKWVQVMETGKIYYADQCEHPIVNGCAGQCLVCGIYGIEYAELIGPDGTSKGMLSGDFGGGNPTDDLQNYVNENGDVIKLVKDIYCPAQNAFVRGAVKVTVDLNGHALAVEYIHSTADITIMNGSYEGMIRNTNPNPNNSANLLTFRNAKAILPVLDGVTVRLENSQVTIEGVTDGINTYQCCSMERLTMDENSRLVLQDVEDGIRNEGKYTLEDSLGSIRDFLPKGYSLARIRKNSSDPYLRNTVVDSNGNVATDIVFCYRRLTDAETGITLNSNAEIYDGTAKTPTVQVIYDGQVLEEGTDYVMTYTNNTKVGNAGITITGKGVYHGETQVVFSIQKGIQAAPTGLSVVNTDKSGAQGGSIGNLSSAMEYSVDQKNWKSVDGESLTGLFAGEYYVRYKETENYCASPATKVVIGTRADADENADESGNCSSTKKVSRVNTGDDTPIEVVLLLMQASAVMAAALLRMKKRK